jgi:hypothetical protein
VAHRDFGECDRITSVVARCATRGGHLVTAAA